MSALFQEHLGLPELWESLDPLLQQLFVERNMEVTIPALMNCHAFAWFSLATVQDLLVFSLVRQYCTVSPALVVQNIAPHPFGDISQASQHFAHRGAGDQATNAQIVGYDLYAQLRAYLMAHCRTIVEVCMRALADKL